MPSCVLAYSGGLDTSVILGCLIDEGYDVHAVYVDLGNSDELVVPLSWTNEAGITFTKTYRFTRGSYIVELQQTVSNNSDSPWEGAEYILPGDDKAEAKG